MKLSEIYRRAFEDDCIELVVNAYNLAIVEKKYQTDWLENDFSELLCYYVNESQFSIDKGITCKTENKLFSNAENQTKGFADKLPRIDFVYFKIWKEQRFHYYMEAKRLKEKDSKLKRSYIKEGMQRYLSEKYPMGCMLGYLLEGNADETKNGINSLLIKDKRNSEVLNLESHNLIKSYYESNHSKIGILKHLIFDFTNNQN
ncbi:MULTISPECIES: hypothetical protein [Chryseobacterium group]|uniref:Restriction endonuclease n=1 Tax=Chryseobacterium suipulveris TaxID=2929800 RepID=A0ABY4BMP7_9FLAO|nr:MULTISPECIES: hypothetical protein [Chryseobacterium]MBP7172786.1 hypothetical protein [Cloacibacterium sp.]UOE40462.1 hypothetical protein MTP09_11160 [Chryseobacterium suipulveris]WES97127.1 hypothetical protein P2W68_20125 [Chryseobacterium arthrosphaerae]WET51641.1 hypothetical protein PYS58_10955 [Chryseobacterium indologenes]WFB66749.1 hypothetical protein PZ898_18725 [Chryseobacterium sp. WX]